MDTQIANLPEEIKSSKHYEKPFGLDRNIASLISGYLSHKDLINLCQTSKGFRGIFYPSLESRLVSLFLQYVFEGRLDIVKGILNAGNNTRLLYLKGDIIDLSGREFKQITAFQYGVWCGDWELWDVFLEFLPEAKAYEQLMELIKENSDVTKTHGAPLSFFDPLLTAYQRYIDNCNQSNWDQCEINWNKEVGSAQRNMPAWFIYVFSEDGKDKAWPQQKMMRGFTRQADHVKTWFEQEYNGGACGSTFAFYRAGAHSRGTAADADCCLPSSPFCGEYVATHDLENSASLKTECTTKLAVLTERLSQASKSVVSLSSPFGVRK